MQILWVELGATPSVATEGLPEMQAGKMADGAGAGAIREEAKEADRG